MMIKRKYIVLALAVVCVIVGSLFYSHITLAQRGREPTIYKDSLSINLLRVGSSGWSSQGASFDPGVAWEHNMPFVFNPQGADWNITNLWYSFLRISGSGVVVEVSLNDIYVTSHSFVSSSQPAYNSFHVVDTSVYEALKPNQINVLSLTHTPHIGSNVVYVQEFTIFIEYEYQAK